MPMLSPDSFLEAGTKFTYMFSYTFNFDIVLRSRRILFRVASGGEASARGGSAGKDGFDAG